MKKYKIPKSSFLYHFIKHFITLILLPVLICWWIYTEVLSYFYANTNLEAQQISMERSLSSLETTLNATSNAITALESNTEIVYYLDYYSDKPEMLYSLERNIRSFCSSLYSMNSYLTGIKIYSDSPILLYSVPFDKLENIPLSGEALNDLMRSGIHEPVWRVSLEEGKTFPAIHRYEKFYAYNYAKSIGYVEITLSPNIFADYFELLENLVGGPDSVFMLYQGDTLIYSSGEPENIALPDETEDTYELHFWKKSYENYVNIPQLGLRLVRTGNIPSPWESTNNILSLLISVILILLLLLFLIFFSSVTSLTKRILDFSSFIRHTAPDNLTSYQPERRSSSGSDELDILINAYNSMINENTALISQVQKMELLSQNARYQALQGQIHPHFIYGTLEAIRMTALQNKDRDAASMIFSLSALIRYSISISSQAVTLKDEVEIATHYLKIQKIRFDERLEYEFALKEDLMGTALPSFILQPLLENAIIYGISQTLDRCHLLIKAYRQGSDIILSVGNTGLPITEERLREVNALLLGTISPEEFHGNRNGMALSNIKERLTIFFHGNASIRMVREQDYTTTVITIQEKGKE